MNGWWIAVAALAVVLIVWRWGVLPARQIRARLRRLASGETGEVFPRPLPFPFSSLDADLRTLETNTEEMRRQFSDESLNLRAILGSMVEGVLIADDRQHIRLLNTGMQNLVHGQPEPMNRTIMEVFRNHELRQAVQETLETGGPVRRELPLEVWAGSGYVSKFFEITGVPLHQPGNAAAMGVIVVFHDITRLKELETIRSEFVANVSHELRTPLSIITGYLETLIDGALDEPEEARRFCEIMIRHSARLNLLVEDLLMLSRLESQADHLQLQPVEIRATCERVILALEPKIAERNARFDLKIAPDLPSVLADPQRIDQIWLNLFDNALKYAANRAPMVEVTAIREDDHVRVDVRDNGPGIPLEDQGHIFERFYRVHKDRARDAGGTGLGLSIVKHLVQNHGGTVGLESVPGHGATFTVRLPISPITQA